MGTKNNPAEFDCYTNAEPDEEMFILLGRDRHASGLVRLWALMREKEGEDEKVVAEARQCADRMEVQAKEKGKVVLSLDAILSLAASLQAPKAQPAPAAAPSTTTFFKEGDVVVPQRGLPCRIERIFTENDDPRVQGKVNVRFPRSPSPTTVELSSLRSASPEEIQYYQQNGGV